MTHHDQPPTPAPSPEIKLRTEPEGRIGPDGKKRIAWVMPVLPPARKRDLRKELAEMIQDTARRKAQQGIPRPRTAREIAHDHAAEAGEATEQPQTQED